VTDLSADLRIIDVHKRFHSEAVLDGLDLAVEAGSITAILGTSGSGKTTLLRIIAGFERADSGAILLGETILEDRRHHVAPARRRISYVSQEGSLFPHHDVAANIAFGLPRDELREARVDELCELLDLRDLEHRYPHQLSGGQQQRVALARALAVNPKIVLFDEPFSSLDARMRAGIRTEIREVLRQAGVTAILVTHDQSEALSFADHVAVIRHGTIAQYAAPAELYAAPVDADMAMFLGEANLLEGHVAGGVATTALGTHEIRGAHDGLPEGDVTVLIRPEQICVEHVDPDGVPGTVVRTDFQGTSALTSVRVPLGDQSAVIVSRTLSDPGFSADAAVRLRAQGPVHVWRSAGAA
jgi:iron(III) transport system ATP-binding protein